MGVKPSAAPPPVVPPHLWRIHGRLYDLNAFASHHPGGQAAISLGRGDDSTLLFESYHITSSRHRNVIDHYLVGNDGLPLPPGFRSALPAPAPVLSAFHADLVVAFRAHFAGKGRAAHKAKTGHSVLMSCVVLLYALSWLGWARGSVSAAVALPFLAWLVMWVPFSIVRIHAYALACYRALTLSRRWSFANSCSLHAG